MEIDVYIFNEVMLVFFSLTRKAGYLCSFLETDEMF